MKVTPLNPQFIVDLPSASEEDRLLSSVDPSQLPVTEAASSAGGEAIDSPLDRQTRDALRRLSRFISGKKSKNQRALTAYDRVAGNFEGEHRTGEILDKVA